MNHTIGRKTLTACRFSKNRTALFMPIIHKNITEQSFYWYLCSGSHYTTFSRRSVCTVAFLIIMYRLCVRYKSCVNVYIWMITFGRSVPLSLIFVCVHTNSSLTLPQKTSEYTQIYIKHSYRLHDNRNRREKKRKNTHLTQKFCVYFFRSSPRSFFFSRIRAYHH